MSIVTVDPGVRVKVVNVGKVAHCFPVGAIVSSTGRNHADVHGKGRWDDWNEFVDENGETQWLKAEHYEVVREVEEKVLDKEHVLSQNGVPARHRRARLYVVVDKKDDIVYYTDDREDAREEKFALGGKANGVRIFAAALLNEIR